MAGRTGLVTQMWKAIGQLNPSRPMRDAGKPFSIALLANNSTELQGMRELLIGPNPRAGEPELGVSVIREYVQPIDGEQREEMRHADAIIYALGTQSGLPRVDGGAFPYDPGNPQQTLKDLACGPETADFRLSMARHLPGFRAEFVRRIVRDVSKENAVFVIVSAAGNYIPSPLLPLIGIAEAASDTVVLTANQVRMLFLIGAAFGANVGYTAQWKEISSIVGAAFGWRAIARQLVSKIPFGGGLAPKGAIAYAGTTAVGESVIFFYTTGRHMTRAEISQVFRDTYSRALETVKAMASKLRQGDGV